MTTQIKIELLRLIHYKLISQYGFVLFMYIREILDNQLFLSIFIENDLHQNHP
jgi:hypothetical protein